VVVLPAPPTPLAPPAPLVALLAPPAASIAACVAATLPLVACKSAAAIAIKRLLVLQVPIR
jgi:hypothetical protein